MISEPSFYLAAVPAVVLMGLAKGGLAGLGLFSLPLMTLFVSPLQSAAIMLPILIVQDAVTVWVYRRSFDRRNLAILLPGAAIGIFCGYCLAAQVSDRVVKLIIGVISLGFALTRLWLDRHGLPPARMAHPVAGYFWGMVGGFTSMIAHAGGPPFQIYVLPQRLPRHLFIGTSAIFYAAMNLFKIAPYFALGQLTQDNLATSAILFPAAIASTWAGVLLVRKVSGERFYTLVYGLLVVVGIKLIWDGLAFS